MTTKKCEQLRCGYLTMGGCRACEECKAEPFVVDENCCRCWNCEHDEGLLRWEEGKGTEEKTTEQEKLKPIVVPMKIK